MVKESPFQKAGKGDTISKGWGMVGEKPYLKVKKYGEGDTISKAGEW
jgi:hypothetical protein